MAGRLSQFLDPARITLQVRSTERAAALAEVAGLLDGHPEVTDFPGFYRDLLDRETLDTTCLGNGIALPHARSDHVKRIVMAVGRSDAGVPFEDADEDVRLLFVVGTPKSNPGDYLVLVGSLCRLLKDAPQRDALFAAPTPEAFIATLQQLEEKVFGPGK